MADTFTKSVNFRNFDKGPPVGAFWVVVNETIPATALLVVGEYHQLTQLAAGKKILKSELIENGDADADATPAADFDIVLIENGLPGEAGDAGATVTTLYNAGTRFQAASTTVVETYFDRLVVDDVDGKAILALKCIAAPATAAAWLLHYRLLMQ